MDSEGLGGKRLVDYDVIVAMESRHRDYVLSLCPECGDKVVVWNVRDPYFMDKEKDHEDMSTNLENLLNPKSDSKRDRR